MSPPPPRPDDEPPPPPVAPSAGWEPVEPPPAPPARDPLLDDPLFAELVEAKPLPDLTVEPAAAPVVEAVEDLPVAEPVEPARAAPVAPPRRRSEEPPPRPRPVAPPPPRRAEDVSEPPKPRWFAACSVLGCFGLGLAGALGFLAYAAVLMMSTIADNRPGNGGHVGGSVRPDPVGPTSMATDRKEIILPGIVDGVGRAAGGRFLLMRIARTGEITVFDPNSGGLGKSIEPGTSGVLFAGSASKLFVYRPTPTGGELQRWDLTSGEREATSSLPPGVPRPDAVATGAGVDGRVYLLNLPENGTATLRVLNPTTLAQETAYALNTWKGGRGKLHVRASDDGTVLGVTSADGAQVVRVPKTGVPTTVKLVGLNVKSPLLAFPAPDGRAVYSSGGVFDPEKGRRKAFGTPYSFPTAVGSGLFLSVERDPDLNTLSEPLSLHLAANPSLSVAVTDVDVPRGLKAVDAGDVSLPPDQRVHLWPAAGVAAVIPTPDPGGRQRLEVRKVDVPKLLREIDKPYLVFGSEPRLWAVRGAEWKYRPEVWTPPGQQVTFSLVGFPEGMRFGPRNELTWTPQAGQGNAEVVIRVESGDLAAEQSFRVALVEPDAGHDPDDHDDD